VNQNVHLKFLDQNGRQFRLQYMRGPIGTVGWGSRVRMIRAWGKT